MTLDDSKHSANGGKVKTKRGVLLDEAELTQGDKVPVHACLGVAQSAPQLADAERIGGVRQFLHRERLAVPP